MVGLVFFVLGGLVSLLDPEDPVTISDPVDRALDWIAEADGNQPVKAAVRLVLVALAYLAISLAAVAVVFAVAAAVAAVIPIPAWAWAALAAAALAGIIVWAVR